MLSGACVTEEVSINSCSSVWGLVPLELLLQAAMKHDAIKNRLMSSRCFVFMMINFVILVLSVFNVSYKFFLSKNTFGFTPYTDTIIEDRVVFLQTVQ